MSKEYNFIVALLGYSASGKDSIARVLANQHGYNYVVSTTTRPIRANEQQDVDYHFVSEDVFQALKDLDKFIEYRYYDTIQEGKNTRWHYGIERSEIDLDKGNYVAVVDTVGLADLEKEFGNRVISFYIDVPYELRKLRAIGRDRFFEEAEFERRCTDDDIKFEGIENKIDVVVDNINFDECVSKVLWNIDYARKLRVFYTQYASY